MSERVLPREIGYERLERYLKILAHSNRLELLSLLRTPRTLDEIRLTPSPSQAGENPERNISRQAVQNHIDRLLEAGLVRVGMTDRKGTRAHHEYVVDHARLFAVVEELRKVSTFEANVPLDPFMTEGLPEARERDWQEGAKLVLVHGIHEGKAFPLRQQDVKAPRGWVIGRAADAHISLEYDPYVSTENAEIMQVGAKFRLLDLRTSKNGTFVNWQRMPVGGEVVLAGGDIIGVGRSLLVFRES
ncbi:MAG: FHA domain-containing protein [Methanobacteriota archaeon]